MLNVQFLFNYLNGIRIFLQIRIRIRIFSSESRIFGFGFENFLTTNKIRIRIRKISGLRIRFGIRIRSKKIFVSTLTYLRISTDEDTCNVTLAAGGSDHQGLPLRLRVRAGSQDSVPLRGQGEAEAHHRVVQGRPGAVRPPLPPRK